MEKRKDNSRWVIGILLLILFISSVALYLHLTQGAGTGDNPEIGVLVFKRKTIERKFDSDVIWDKIDSGLIIYNKDTIRSGDFSDAVLTLKDETKININENSMIYLDVSDDNVNLNFAYGSLSLDQKKNGNSPLKTMKISSGTVVLDLKNTKITIEKKGKEELNFHVKEGNVKLTDGKKEKSVKANETVLLKDKEVIVSEVSMNLLQPADNSILTGRSRAIPISFQWNVKSENRLKLEIALDSRFTSIRKTYNVSGNSFSTNLESGNYFWRLSTEKGKKKDAAIQYSSFNKFTALSTSPPTLNYPKNNHKFFYTSVTPMIDFGWNRLEVAKNYKLELSSNSNFSR